jgi:hypothetical protein
VGIKPSKVRRVEVRCVNDLSLVSVVSGINHIFVPHLPSE